MQKFDDPQLDILWQTLVETREDYFASEEALMAYELAHCASSCGRPHEVIGKAEKLRERRDEAQERYRAADRRFVAFRDAYLLARS